MFWFLDGKGSLYHFEIRLHYLLLDRLIFGFDLFIGPVDNRVRSLSFSIVIFCSFASVHNHGGFKIKQSRCDSSQTFSFNLKK